MTTIPKRRLGRHGPEVSQLGLGCMRLPLLPGGTAADVDEAAAVAMIRRAVDGGVDYVDTAYPYHSSDHAKPGRSETVVARALSGGYREKVKLATKLPLWLVESRADMDRLLDEQLRRLETDGIDFYLAHNINTGVWPKVKDLGLLDFFDAALKDGRIKHAAFSFHDQFRLFKEVMESYDWSMAQIQYNYLDVDYQAGRQGVALAAERGAGLVVMEPLRGGFLINNLGESMVASLKAARPAWSLADWGLRWLWDQPDVGVVLSGMSSMEQLEENLLIAGSARPHGLGEKERAALAAVRKEFADRIQVGCTACGYCLPCPFGVAIPKVFSFYNEAFMSDDPAMGKRAAMLYAHTLAEGEHADHCTRCGACVPKCPQNIAIPENMAKAAAYFATQA